jgi:hypothetical protein
MQTRVNTRARVTTISTLLAAGAFASLPGVLQSVAAQDQATPETSDAFADLGLPELNLTVSTDGVEGVPESTEAGRYLLRLNGEPFSETSSGGVLILQLPDGMSLDDAMATPGPENAPPDFYYDSVLPGGAAIGESGTSVSVIDLPPGEWIVAGAQLSTPPVIMAVTGEMPADLPEPESNATFTMGEMFIEVSEGELVAGENLIRLVNNGDQPHFVDFNKVPDGTTNENIAATVEAEMGGTPGPDAVDFADIQFITSSGDQSSGTTMWMSLTLEAGTYAGLCFFPDEETGMPHAAMGMHTVFAVEAPE